MRPCDHVEPFGDSAVAGLEDTAIEPAEDVHRGTHEGQRIQEVAQQAVPLEERERPSVEVTGQNLSHSAQGDGVFGSVGAACCGGAPREHLAEKGGGLFVR